MRRVMRACATHSMVIDIAMNEESRQTLDAQNDHSEVRHSQQPTALELKYILGLQRQLLAMIADGLDLDQIIDFLCHNIREVAVDSSVLTLLRPLQGKHFEKHLEPDPFHPIPDTVLQQDISSSTMQLCASNAQPIFVDDTSTHRDWRDEQALAQQLQLASCWSYPIFGAKAQPIGSISILNRQKGYPSTFIAQLLETAAYTLGVAYTSLDSKSSLVKTQAQLHNITQSLPVALLQINLQSTRTPLITYSSKSVNHIFNLAEREPPEFQQLWTQLGSTIRRRLVKQLKQARPGQSFNHEISLQGKAGKKRWFYLSATIDHSVKHDVYVVNCLLMDISQERHNRQRLELSSIAFNNASEGILVADAAHKIIEINA
ncbi:MAG: GAF domain-containing protein, partial [Pseudomonadales bacterium]